MSPLYRRSTVSDPKVAIGSVGVLDATDVNLTRGWFDVPWPTAGLSNVGWDTFLVLSTAYLGGYVTTDNTSQNNERVYLLPGLLQAGTWKIVLEYSTNTNCGIVTASVSPDGSTWTDLLTVDSYSASIVTAVRTSNTGLTIGAGNKYLRLKMATKNASSTGYFFRMSGVSGVRTGA